MGFPNVPNLPGVPRLPRPPSAANVARSAFGVIAATGWRLVTNRKIWAILDENDKPIYGSNKFTDRPKFVGDIADTLGLRNSPSFLSLDYSKEYRTSDFPVEDGSFANYNKVQMPGNSVVELCMGGSDKDRKLFLEELDKACASTKLYSIVTPNVKYIGVSLVRYGYSRRAESGAQLLIVAIEIKQVRRVTAQISVAVKTVVAAKEAAGNSPVGGGRSSPEVVDDKTLKKLSEGQLSVAVTETKKIGGASEGANRFFIG